MEIIFKDYIINNEDNKISLTINHNKIIGIIKKTNEDIIKAISLKKIFQGELTINGIEVNCNNYKAFYKRINLIDDSRYIDKNNTIKEIMINEIKLNNIELDNQDKKMRDSLKIVGLSKEYLNRNFNTLSNLEKKLVALAIGLISNPNVLIINEPFKNLDLNYKKALNSFYNKIKEQYNKTIIFVSDDIETLYLYTEEIIIAKKNKVLKQGKTEEIITNVDFLKKNKIKVPEIVELTDLIMKEKNVKLSYHKDVRDILKDIYKHV